MAQLKWDQFNEAVKRLNDRARSMQVKVIGMGIADDLGIIRDALSELQGNTMKLQADNEKLHAQLYKFINPGTPR